MWARYSFFFIGLGFVYSLYRFLWFAFCFFYAACGKCRASALHIFAQLLFVFKLLLSCSCVCCCTCSLQLATFNGFLTVDKTQNLVTSLYLFIYSFSCCKGRVYWDLGYVHLVVYKTGYQSVIIITIYTIWNIYGIA